MNRIIFVMGFVFLTLTVYSQNTRSTTSTKPPKPVYQAQKKEKKKLFSFLKKKEDKKTAIGSREEFRAGLVKMQREKSKIAYKQEKTARREAKKGQSFFGHKRPPKKRPPGKQKFCKICRIKH